MPHLSGGELFYELTKLQYFTEERTKFYTTQIICGLEYLHAHGFYYCDLKPEAFLLSAQGNLPSFLALNLDGLACMCSDEP